jgi:hypothetical protein
MESTGQEVGRIETRVRQFGTKLDRLLAQADADGGAESDYRRQLGEVKEKHATVRSRLDAFKAARGQKWDNFRNGVEAAWRETMEAFATLAAARRLVPVPVTAERTPVSR